MKGLALVVCPGATPSVEMGVRDMYLDESIDLPDIRTVEDLISWLQDHGISYEVLGKNFAGQPIIVVKKEGSGGEPLVITAGAHTSEPAGVLATLLLLRDLDIDNPLYVVPLRDPFGWQGYELCLEYALGEAVTLTDHMSLEDLLLDRGEEILLKEPGFVLARIKDIVFASLVPPGRPTGPREVEQRVNQVLRDHPELMSSLVGSRVVFPGNAGDSEGVWDFYRAFSAVISDDGIVADMNRQFGGVNEPPEVSMLRQLVDDVQPGMVLDIHEGQGSTFYLFVPGYYQSEETQHYTKLIWDTMVAEGVKMFTVSDLAKALGPQTVKDLDEPLPGVLVGKIEGNRRAGTSFAGYCRRFGPSITFETGRWAPLAQRVGLHLLAAKTLIEAYTGK